ncbi:EAL domain-containing protein [Pantoea sp. 1.19]|uniref:sensor domain-containing protein n=1 Tax=Pantoea sp. 1.19 TaxID=1925589 RepID=UPI0009489A98|nr:EAL domain-containing protein [Pantoea sp. 1.19]
MTPDNDMMYRLLVQGVVDYAIYLLKPDGTVANWNAGAQRAKGYLSHEIIGKNFACFYSADDQARGVPQRGLDIARRTGRFEAEGWRYRKDGSAFWAHVVIDAIYHEGMLIGFAKITRDCTEHQQALQAQRAQEQKFRLLVEGVTDYAIYMLDPSGRVENWNAGAQRTKGYSSAEIVGRHFSCFYSAEDRARGIPDTNLSLARRVGRFEDEGWRYRKDGSAFWAHVVIDAIYDEQGELIGFAKITRDCTERREQQQQLLLAKELAESNNQQLQAVTEFLETVIGNIPSCVMVEDAVTREICHYNQRAEQLLGEHHGGLVGKRIQQCVNPELHRFLDELAGAALRGGGMHKREQSVLTISGERVLNTSATLIHSADARSNYVLLIVDDVTDQRHAHARIHHMAHHDNLTGLPNRVLFRQRLNEALQRDRSAMKQTATLCLDLDNFKNVNDALGHQIGDLLLCAVATRLQCELRDGDTLARLGGDEFAVVLSGLSHPSEAGEIAARLIESVRPAFSLEGHSMAVGVSIGIGLDAAQSTPEDLLRNADMALYDAKRNGRNRMAFFSSEMDVAARERRLIEMDLREAIGQDQLHLYYQPITDCQGTDITGYEALLRWQHPQRGLLLPGEFIAIAEETGLIHALGANALHEACQEAINWPASQSVAVNLSPLQFKNSGLIAVVESALRESGLAPERLEIEITESVLLDNTLQNLRTLQGLKALGVRIALDDFGTGYSSLGYLRTFPFDKIKIDKSFINDMQESRESLAIIRAITGMSRSLDIQITAEGVENSEQFDRLREEGCTLFQGYYFGQPQPSATRLKRF